MTTPDKQRAALEAAAHWIEEQAWSPIAENSEILRVIREALGARPTLDDYETAARAAGWQFEPYTADIATPDYPGYWWRRDDDGPGNDEDETAKRGFACLTADNARIACQQIDGIEPDDAPDAAPVTPPAPDASALMLQALKAALQCPQAAPWLARAHMADGTGSVHEAMSRAVAAAEGREG